MGSGEDHSKIKPALASIGLSAVLLFGATLLGRGLGFLTRITMARYLPVDGYGNVVLGFTLMNLLGIVVLVGLPAALSRYLPQHQSDTERRAILSTAFQIVGILSVIFAAALFLAAKPVATLMFKNEGFVWIIRIFAGILPFYALFKLSLGGFRGYEQTYPRVLTQNVLRPGLQLAGIILFVLAGYDTAGIAFAYAMAFVGVGVISTVLLYRESELSVQGLTRRGSAGRYRELLAFSVPLAASTGTSVIAKNSDLIILGIFKSISKVGIYDVAFRMGLFVVVLFAPAFGYLFQPIISRFEAAGDWQRIDELYTVITRWSVIATVPVFALFFLFPGQTLTFFFGEKYQSGQTAMQILLVGFMIAMLPGLTSNFLTAVGDTKLLMYTSSGAMFLNVLANFALIPIYGIIGAAIATVTARIFGNTVQMYLIYNKYGVNPFNQGYIVPTALMSGLILLLFFAPVSLAGLTFIEATLVAVGIGILSIIIIFATRSIYAVELELIDIILGKIGLSVSVTRYLQPFVR